MSSGRDHDTSGDGWDGILVPGERILWQGRPHPGVQIGPGQVFSAAFGALFAGFAAFWMLMASRAGGYFWTFGLIHFSVGIGLMIGSFTFAPWRRRHTWYTLTDRRAFVATDMPFRGRTLKSWVIDGDSVIEHGPDDTVNFARDFRQTKNGTRIADVGFERIDDPDHVLRLMQQIRDRALLARPAAEAEHG